MIFEKLAYTVDVEKLRDSYNTNVAHLPMIENSPGWGGWSILSSDGTHEDGWQAAKSFTPVAEGSRQFQFDSKRAWFSGVKTSSKHINPTPLYTGYVAEVIGHIHALGLNPRRARWIALRANSVSLWHRSAPEGTYAVRLVIPVITNSMCMHLQDDIMQHIPADGSTYLVAISKMHRVENRSDQDRIHIVMDVTDTKGISQNFKFVK